MTSRTCRAAEVAVGFVGLVAAVDDAVAAEALGNTGGRRVDGRSVRAAELFVRVARARHLALVTPVAAVALAVAHQLEREAQLRVRLICMKSKNISSTHRWLEL